jgi:hypothetical protein
MNSIVEADVPNGLEISYMKDTLEKIVPMFVGETFFNGFMQPIFSPLKQVTPVNSRNTTPRNTVAQMDIPIQGFIRGSDESIGSVVELG